MINTFSTGLLWGISYFFLGTIPSHYYYIYFGVSVGLTSAGLLSLSIIPLIFYSFAIPLMGLSLFWMFLQNDATHNIVAFVTSIGIVYYFTFGNRYALRFKQSILDKETLRKHLIELKEAQKANTILRERTELALKGSGTSVLDWNFVNHTSYISPSWKEMLGFQDKELDNSYATWKRRVHKDDIFSVLHRLKETDKAKKTTFTTTHRLRHKDGHYLWILGQALLFYDENQKLTRMIGTHIDITSEKIIQEKLLAKKEKFTHLAHHDALTGLPNRLLFVDRLEHTLAKAKRNHTKIALFFIDLDHFKEINDSYGHDIGDKVLQSVTQLLLQTMRDEDSIARLGGDEFTIIIDNIQTEETASLLAQKIIDVLTQALLIDTYKFYVSCSIGISLYPEDGHSSADLLKYADSAMYRAKSEGRNNYQFYKPEMTELALERVVMEKNLRDAIANEEFVVYYQAQMDASKNRIIGMEALVRWIHPELGMVSPDQFIPLAEATGLIVKLDRFVMKTAMMQLMRWIEQGYNPGVLAMNLAIKQLQQEDFLAMFTSLITETQCKPQYLELELTEGQIMTNPHEAIKTLQQINALGVTLAIDDFGTGYSSLSYLKKFPLSKLKIDKSFINDLPIDEEDASITKAIIALAKSLKLDVIAEGVETEEQKDFLLKNGCNNIQGYFYAKPLPSHEFEKLFTTL